MTGAPIVIAGAGIGGLAAAVALAEFDVPLIVVERADAPYELGNGLQLGPNATRLLHRFGLAEALRPHLFQPDAIELRSARGGAQLAAIPLGRVARERYGAPYATIARRALHRVLTEQSRRHGVAIRYGVEVTGHCPSGDGIEVACGDGSTLSARGLVGADGLWSAVRNQLAGAGAPTHVGDVAWRAVVAMDQVPESLRGRRVVAWLGPRVHAVHYPIEGGQTLNLVVVTEGAWVGEGWEETADEDALKDLAATLASPLAELILAAANWRRWPLFETRPAITVGSGPVTLLGDAAHPMLPYAAQGAAMAIEDAAVLADAVAGAPGNVGSAFRAYERRRRDRLDRVLDRSRRNGRVFHLDGAMALARDATLRALPGRALLAGYDWLYGGAPSA